MEEHRVLEEVQLAAQEVAIRLLLEQVVGYRVSRWSSSQGVPLAQLLEDQSALAELYEKYEDHTSKKNKKSAHRGSKKKLFSAKKKAAQSEPEEDEDDEVSVSDLSEALEDLVEPEKKTRQHTWGRAKAKGRQRTESMSGFSESEDEYGFENDNDNSAAAEESSCDEGFTTEDESLQDSISVSEIYTIKQPKPKRKFFAKPEERITASPRDSGKLTKKLTEDDVLRAKKADAATEVFSKIDHSELSLLILMELLIRPNNNPLLTFNFMRQPIDDLAAEIFLAIKPSAIKAWLKALNPMIKVFYKGDAEKLFYKFQAMRRQLETLKDYPDMTHLELLDSDLLKQIKAKLEITNVNVRYRSVIQSFGANADQYVEQYMVVPVEEFAKNPRDQQYRIIPNGCDHVVLNHAGGVFDVVRPNVLDTRSYQYMLTSTEMLEEFETVLAEWDKINQIEEQFKMNNITPFLELKSERSKEVAVNNFNLAAADDVTFKNTLVKALQSGQFSPTTLSLRYLSAPSLMLQNALSLCGVRVTRLDLSYSSGVDDKIFRVLSDHCANLIALTMHNVAVSKIGSKLPKLRSLDLSFCPSFEDNIFKDLKRYCQSLDSLVLSGTHVSGVSAELDVTHLDLTNCKNVTDDIFAQLKKYCKKLISLVLRNSAITAVNFDALELSYLDVSGCNNLTQLHAKRARQTKKGLVTLKANNCISLESIVLYDTSRLYSLAANYCQNLESVRLAPKKSSPTLEVIELDGDASLQTLEARPYNLKILRLLDCVHITAPLSHQLLELLFAQATSGARHSAAQKRAASAAGLLSRNLGADFLFFIKNKTKDTVFCGKDLSGMDASNGNWGDINLTGANLQNSRWNNAYISGTIFTKADMTGATFGRKLPYEDHDDSICSVAYSPNGLLIATGYTDGTVVVRNHSEVIHTFKVKGYVNTVAFSPDGKLLALAGTIVNKDDSLNLTAEDYSNNHCVVLFNLTDKDAAPVYYKSHSSDISAVAFSPCGQYLASASDDDTVKIRCLKTNEIKRHDLHQAAVNSIAWHPDGKYLASGGDDKNIFIWDVQQASVVAVLGGENNAGHEKRVSSIAYSPDGRFVVSNSDDKMVKVWDAINFKCMRSLEGHRRNPECIAVSPDSRLIASGESLHKNCKTIIWDVTSGKMVQELGHVGGVTAMAFKPDAKRPADGWLLLTAEDKKVDRWQIDGDLVPQGLLRKEQYSSLDAAMADISDVLGLSEENIELLHHLNAFSKPI